MQIGFDRIFSITSGRRVVILRQSVSFPAGIQQWLQLRNKSSIVVKLTFYFYGGDVCHRCLSTITTTTLRPRLGNE